MTSIAVIFGASGGIGSAMRDHLEAGSGYDKVIALHRTSSPPLDLLDERMIEACADRVREEGDVRLLFDATGALTLGSARPERACANSILKSLPVHTRSTPLDRHC